uniref:AAA ATPase AAA+ lid domain-containing protein n=1 Tax=Plectus sambesii TaxID=2011161 RepID=A0A914X096_9BILA
MATNRPDTLDPALVRPGRLDRKIEFALPELEGRAHIFKIHAKQMSVERNIRYDLLARLCPNSTGAEIRSVCTEAGMFAIRARRKVATEKDFLEAINKVYKRSCSRCFARAKGRTLENRSDPWPLRSTIARGVGPSSNGGPPFDRAPAVSACIAGPAPSDLGRIDSLRRPDSHAIRSPPPQIVACDWLFVAGGGTHADGAQPDC